MFRILRSLIKSTTDTTDRHSKIIHEKPQVKIGMTPSVTSPHHIRPDPPSHFPPILSEFQSVTRLPIETKHLSPTFVGKATYYHVFASSSKARS